MIADAAASVSASPRRGRACAAAVVCALLGAARAAAQEAWDRPVVVDGRVVRVAEGGAEPRPVADAVVELRPYLGDLRRDDRRKEALQPPLATTRTNARGEFALALPEWTTVVDRPLVLVAEKDGDVHTDVIEPFQRATHHVEMPLAELPGQAAAPLRLMDAGTLAFPRRKITTLLSVPRARNHRKGVRVVGHREFEGLVAGPTTETDDEGRGKLAGGLGLITLGDKLVLVRRRDDGPRVDVLAAGRAARSALDELATALAFWAETEEESRPPAPAAAAAELAKARGDASITGRVVDARGGPLQGAEVSACAPDAPLGCAASLFTSESRPTSRPFAQTGADGTFAINRVPAGKYRLRVAAPGYAPAATESFKLERGAVRDVPPIAVVRGARVRVKDAFAFLMLEDEEQEGVVLLPENGVLEGVGPGKLRARTSEDGFRYSVFLKRPVAVPEAGETLLDFAP